MRRLRKLKIGDRTYRVRYRELAHIYGQIGLGYGFLDLADDLNEEEGVYTIIHEVLHGIWAYRQLPPRPREERVVTEFAWGLMAVFRDNPGLLNHLESLLTESRGI
jgi:hypothetical protein